MSNSIKYNNSVVNSAINTATIFPSQYDNLGQEIEEVVSSIINANGFSKYVNTLSSGTLSGLISDCSSYEEQVITTIREIQIKTLAYSHNSEDINNFIRTLTYKEYNSLDLTPISKYINEETLKIKADAIIPHSKISEEEREARKKYLMPNGEMSGDEEQELAYITSIDVDIWTGSELKTQNVRVNTKLADRTKALFKELADIKYPIDWGEGFYQVEGYEWRAPSSGRLSDHGYGGAFDINGEHNPHDWITYDEVPNTPYKIDERVVNIMAKYGFYWGGDWELDKENTELNLRPDYMHFSYTGR